MPKTSSGILLYRRDGADVSVLLVHPGGPLWQSRDIGAWSIPKGERDETEDSEVAARREFAEETGCRLVGPLHSLGRVRQNGGKWVEAFAVEGDFDVATLQSNTFDLQWPPRSGRIRTFPEVDRAAWFSLDEARVRLLAGQVPLLDRLGTLLSGNVTTSTF